MPDTPSWCLCHGTAQCLSAKLDVVHVHRQVLRTRHDQSESKNLIKANLLRSRRRTFAKTLRLRFITRSQPVTLQSQLRVLRIVRNGQARRTSSHNAIQKTIASLPVAPGSKPFPLRVSLCYCSQLLRITA